MAPEADTCVCDQCLQTDKPCHYDCDIDDPCEGCISRRDEREEIKHEIDKAVGRL
jgi:hypothetical protein